MGTFVQARHWFTMARTQRNPSQRAIKKKNKGSFPTQAKKAAAPSAPAAQGFYPGDDTLYKRARRFTPRAAKLKGSIVPGSVLILLAGKFRGSRVVFLKQLESGLLLVTGPFAVNGVPLRRVNQAYVVATSTKVELPNLSLDKFDDKYFQKEATKSKKDAEGFLAEEGEKKEVPQARKDDQKAADSAIVAAIKKVDSLQGYLSSKFSLSNGQFAHELKF